MFKVTVTLIWFNIINFFWRSLQSIQILMISVPLHEQTDQTITILLQNQLERDWYLMFMAARE